MQPDRYTVRKPSTPRNQFTQHTNANDQLIVREIEVPFLAVSIHLRYFNQPLGKVHILRLGLQEMTIDALNDAPNRLDQRPEPKSPNSSRRKHRREKEIIRRRNHRDMIIPRPELFQQRNASPARSQNDQPRLIFLVHHRLRVLIRKQCLRYGQVLWAPVPRIQRQFRHGDVHGAGVFSVCGCIVDKEGDYRSTGGDYKKARIRESLEDDIANGGWAGCLGGLGADRQGELGKPTWRWGRRQWPPI